MRLHSNPFLTLLACATQVFTQVLSCVVLRTTLNLKFSRQYWFTDATYCHARGRTDSLSCWRMATQYSLWESFFITSAMQEAGKNYALLNKIGLQKISFLILVQKYSSVDDLEILKEWSPFFADRMKTSAFLFRRVPHPQRIIFSIWIASYVTGSWW